MRLRLHFSVPLAVGWAGVKRHFLVNSGERSLITRVPRRTRRCERGPIDFIVRGSS
jgi:hypothetical protein